MHFGEYELSPSLISLSPPPSAHPEAFQRLSVRKYSLIIQKINFPLFVIFIRRSIKKKRTKGRLLFDNHVVVYVQIRDV